MLIFYWSTFRQTPFLDKVVTSLVCVNLTIFVIQSTFTCLVPEKRTYHKPT